MRRLFTGNDLEARDPGGSLTMSPDGRTVAVAAAGQVVLVDLDTMRPSAHLTDLLGVDDVTYSADGTRLAVGGAEAVVWDIAAEEPVEILRQEGAGGRVAFSRDGQTLFSADFDGMLMAWDLSGQRGFLPAPGGRAGRHGALLPPAVARWHTGAARRRTPRGGAPGAGHRDRSGVRPHSRRPGQHRLHRRGVEP